MSYIIDTMHDSIGWYQADGSLKSDADAPPDALQKLREQQEWFDDLYGDKGKPLMFDFTLYINNKWIGSIEYNGQQHYHSVDVFGGESAFRQQVEYDKRKLLYCLNHGVPILQVAYDYPKRFMSIEDEVMRFLENLNLI